MDSTFVLFKQKDNPVLKSNIKSTIYVIIPTGTQTSKLIIHYQQVNSSAPK